MILAKWAELPLRFNNKATWRSQGFCCTQICYAFRDTNYSTIERLNETNGDIDLLELERVICDTWHSPREVYRFYNKHTSWDCLADICKNLKETSTWTTQCFTCMAQKELSNIVVCSRCNIVDHSSKECQQADWPDHKKKCKEWASKQSAKKKSS
jgi:hypothetical protein